MQTRSGKRKSKKKIIIGVIVSVVLIILSIVGYEGYKLFSAADKIQIATNKKSDKKVSKGKPITILLLGLDTGALGRNDKTYGIGNTDTIELATVNPLKNTITLTSIPRDTLVKIESSKGTGYSKINAAYSIGGINQTKKSVSELLNVPIDYYALVDMGVLEKVVNAVGGVDVDNPFTFKDPYSGNYTFNKGKLHLDGVHALAYSRMRHQDPNEDYGRQNRQQQVIKSVIQKLKSINSVGAINKIIDASSDGIKADAPITRVASLYPKYKAAMDNVQMNHFQGQDAMVDESSVQIPSTDEINKISKNIRTALGLTTDNVENNETKLYDSNTQYDGTSNTSFNLPSGFSINELQ